MRGLNEAIDRGLETYRELVRRDAALEAEFASSQTEFFAARRGAPVAAVVDDALAARRHMEWFLLERPSDAAGGVPAEALRDRWDALTDGPERDLEVAFLQSLASAFEITESAPGEGLWIRDLFGQASHAIDEPEASLNLQIGDLLVGRIFPIGDGRMRLSKAVACFRRPELVEALTADIGRMREARRGVLRIEQKELERLFFTGAFEPHDQGSDRASVVDLAAERNRLAHRLCAAGMAKDSAARVLADVARSASAGVDVVPDLLDELAFGTDVDLEAARTVLGEAWTLERGATTVPEPARTELASAEDDRAVEAEAVREALASFDAGKQKGKDLEELFQRLADDLGVDESVEGDEASAVPDFPGVVGAMVEEFLWDVGRARGDAVAARLACLRKLSDYASGIGLFEDLRSRELLDFAGRWLLDEGGLRGPEESRAVLDAVGEFCRWAEEHHSHPLWTDVQSFWEGLVAAVPRLVSARAHARLVTGGSPWDVIAVDGEVAVLRDGNGDERRMPVDGPLGELLRAGDLVHARDRDDGAGLVLSAIYPAELRGLLERDRSAHDA